MGLEGRPEAMHPIIREDSVNMEIEPEHHALFAIYTSPKMGTPMEEHFSVHAFAGLGLEGDRYAIQAGAYSEKRIGKQGRIPDDDRQVTLISLPGIQEANRKLQEQELAPFDLSETRRNLVVTLPAEQLSSLVGQRFSVGGVEMEGAEVCEPCTRPAILSGRKQDGRVFESAFENRGGLRARIINDGILHVGDQIVLK